MPDYKTDPDRPIRDVSNTPREVNTGMGRKRGGGTDPDDEIDVGNVESEGSDTGTEAGVGSERGGMGMHGVGYTARLASEGGGELEDDDDEIDDLDGDEEDEEDVEDEDLDLDDLDVDEDEDEEDEMV